MRGAVTGTSTILFTDAGSTALRTILGEKAADGLRREHDGLLRTATAEHRGRVVKGAGRRDHGRVRLGIRCGGRRGRRANRPFTVSGGGGGWSWRSEWG